MVVNMDTGASYEAVRDVYYQLKELRSRLIEGVPLEQFYRSLVYGVGPQLDVSAHVIKQGADLGKLTLSIDQERIPGVPDEGRIARGIKPAEFLNCFK